MHIQKRPAEVFKEVEVTYQRYQEALGMLAEERNKILNEFRDALEKRKIENIRQEISN